MAGETPNIFILLDLDPEKAPDRVACETRLDEKRREWARASTGIGNSAKEAKTRLDLIPEIRRILADDQLRMEQAGKARTERAKAGEEQRKLFREKLRVAEANGQVFESQITSWVKEFAGALTEREIRDAIHVPVRAAEVAPTRAARLDPTRAKRIRDSLDILNQASLYTLLTTVNPATPLGPQSSAAHLLNAADTLYKQMQQQMIKDTQVSEKQKMAGEARAIFGNPAEKAKYDETLRREPMDALLARYAEVCAPAKAISEEQARLFLEDARKLGWDLNTATQELRELARSRSFSLSLPGSATLDALAKQVRCGKCHEMNDAGRPNCWNCGEPLYITCPNCGGKVAADDVSCPHANCGFAVGNRFLVSYLADEADRLLAQHNLAGARTSLDEAIHLWAPKQADPLRQRLDRLRAQAQRESEDQQRISSQVKELLDERNFFAARTLLSSLSDSFTGRDASLRLAEERIREAQSYVRQALAEGVSADRKADLCTQALRVCADYTEARDMLAKMPPEPPTNLVVTPSDRIVSLKWTPSTTRNAGYVVVRKSGSKPVSAKDGQQIGKAPGTNYDDIQPVLGLPLYYAVYADREGVTSAAGAVAARSTLLLAEVGQLAHRVSDGAIELTWQTPANAARVSVARKEGGIPRGPTDGATLTPIEAGRLVDRGLVNGRSYGYAVYCQFRDQDGSPVTSRGVTLEAIPETPPQPIQSFALNTTPARSGFDVRLTWQAPTKGDAAVLKSPQEPKLRTGEVLPVDTLSRFGQVLQGERYGLTDHWNTPGVAYYAPLVLFQKMAYIGPARRWVCIDDVRNLKVQNLGPTLRLQWEWPQGCNDALVAYDRATWPQPGVQPSTSTLRVTRAEYERLGYTDLGASGSQDYYITVAAVVQHGGDTITGTGARTHLRLASLVTLEYDLRSPGRLFGAKHYRLLLHSSAPVALPVLLLRSKRLGLPMSKNDGDLVYRSAGAVTLDRELEIELPDRHYAPNTYAKLFLEDDAAYDAIKLFHPDREKLRLS